MKAISIVKVNQTKSLIDEQRSSLSDTENFVKTVSEVAAQQRHESDPKGEASSCQKYRNFKKSGQDFNKWIMEMVIQQQVWHQQKLRCKEGRKSPGETPQISVARVEDLAQDGVEYPFGKGSSVNPVFLTVMFPCPSTVYLHVK